MSPFAPIPPLPPTSYFGVTVQEAKRRIDLYPELIEMLKVCRVVLKPTKEEYNRKSLVSFKDAGVLVEALLTKAQGASQ